MADPMDAPMIVNGNEFLKGVVTLLLSTTSGGIPMAHLADCFEHVAGKLRERVAADEAAKQAQAAPRKRTRARRGGV